MVAIVSFIGTTLNRDTGGEAIARVRAMEKVTVPGSTVTSARKGEVVVIGSTEAAMVTVAVGSNPDAAATEESAVTSAGYPLPAGAMSDPFILNAGDKVNIKAA